MSVTTSGYFFRKESSHIAFEAVSSDPSAKIPSQAGDGDSTTGVISCSLISAFAVRLSVSTVMSSS